MHSFPYGSNGRADAPGRENDSLVGRFAEEHYDKVYRYCARRLPSKEDAQDVTQEVFLRLTMAGALARLTEEEREVIELRYGQDLPMSDISAVTGKSRFALYRIERRALGRLKELMGEGNG